MGPIWLERWRSRPVRTRRRYVLPLVDDGFYEGDEVLVLRTHRRESLSPCQLDGDRKSATGVIKDDDLEAVACRSFRLIREVD